MPTAASNPKKSPAEAQSLSTGKLRATVIAVALLVSYLRLFRLPFTPVLLGGDQLFFWTYGQRVVHGQLPYRDFFQITGVGADYVFAALFRIFGESIWVTDAVVVALSVSLTLVCFEVARRFARAEVAVVTSFLYLALVYFRILSGTHHLFSVLLAMCAVLVIGTAEHAKGIFWGGVLLGAASVFTQTRGVFAAAAISLGLLIVNCLASRSMLRGIAAVWGGFVAVLLPIEALLAWKVGLHQLWYYQVSVPSRWLGSNITSPWWTADAHTLGNYVALITVYATIPAVYGATAWRLLASRGRGLNATALLTMLVGAAMCFEIASAANQIRIFSIALPAFALLALWLQELRQQRLVLVIAMLIAAVQLTRGVWSMNASPMFALHSAAGTFVAPPVTAKKIAGLQSKMKNGDEVFEAAYPSVYLPLGSLEPVYADAVLPNRLTPSEIVGRTVRELRERRVRFIVWNEALDYQPDTETRMSFEEFRSFVRENYLVVQTLESGEQILELKNSASKPSQ